jgi:hypothetical protein
MIRDYFQLLDGNPLVLDILVFLDISIIVWQKDFREKYFKGG